MKKYHRETHEEMKKLFGDLGKNIEDVKSDLGTKIEDVDKRVDNVVNEIKPYLQLQRDAVGIVVPEVLSLRRKCRKATPKSPQQEHENRNQQLYELQARAGVRASSPLLGCVTHLLPAVPMNPGASRGIQPCAPPYRVS